MCQYINIILPAETHLEKLKPLFAKHGLAYRPFQNGFITRQLKKGGQLVNTTTNQCDCGSVIASGAHSPGNDIQENDLEKLRRKGWSDTKINNWVENKSKSDTRTEERDKERDRWTNFLKEMILESKIGRVGLYIHWYDNNIEEEELTFQSRVRVQLSEFQHDTLDKLAYDTLYEFIE